MLDKKPINQPKNESTRSFPPTKQKPPMPKNVKPPQDSKKNIEGEK